MTDPEVTQRSHPDISKWRFYVRHWFPNLQEKTYFVPPVHMNRVHYQPAHIHCNKLNIAGEDVHITHPPVSDLPEGAPKGLQESHVREDQTLQRILCCIKHLTDANPQPMVVISQLEFGDYLGQPSYAAAASCFPRPIDLKKKQLHKGDFDLVLVDKDHGLFVAEIKIVGDNLTSLSLSSKEQDNLLIVKLNLGIRQLLKGGEVLSHLVSDQQRPPRVRKTLMLPNISRSSLQRVLAENDQLRQELCKCLDIRETTDPADVCACADDFDENCDERLSEWWERLILATGPEEPLTDDVYEDLVARFAGPATTVQVFWVSEPRLHFRSEGEGVHESSFRFTRFVLHPYQLDVLNRNLPLVYLCGPPGTGKTLVLVVRARDWWGRGWPVHVINTHDGSLAATHLIAHQLKESAEPKGERVLVHQFNFKMWGHVEAAVKALQHEAETQKQAGLGPLCVIADEAYGGSEFTDFCDELVKRVPDIHLWAASLHHTKRPPCLTEVPMTEPLRTPPVITKEVRQSESIRHNRVYDYTDSSTPPPCQGPKPRVLKHQGAGHSEGKPVECEKCGMEVAKVLQELHVGVASADETIPAPLNYRDVFLLTAWDEDDLHEEERDSHDRVIKLASGVVTGLRNAGVPVRVVRYGDAEAVKSVAVMDGPDEVTAAWVGTISGLERAVVVWIQTQRTGTVTVDEDLGWLSAVSRTTGKLVWVMWPFDP